MTQVFRVAHKTLNELNILTVVVHKMVSQKKKKKKGANTQNGWCYLCEQCFYDDGFIFHSLDEYNIWYNDSFAHWCCAFCETIFLTPVFDLKYSSRVHA